MLDREKLRKIEYYLLNLCKTLKRAHKERETKKAIQRLCEKAHLMNEKGGSYLKTQE